MMNIETIADQLAHVGYIVLEQPLLPAQSTQLYSRCQDDERQRFQPARIGRNAELRQLDVIRGDMICWLDDRDGIDHDYLVWMEELRSGLNSALYLGLFDYECHYAIYRTGAGYARHSDVLSGRRNRVLSTVFYLNNDWQLDDGGQLVLFAPEGDGIIDTVNPTFGKMVIFLSESFPHAVLSAGKPRRSIAGWFRVRDVA
jgi:SM-20-related protein